MTLLEQAKEFAEDCDLYNYPIEAMAEFAESVTPKWTYCNDAMPEDEGPEVFIVTIRYKDRLITTCTMWHHGQWLVESNAELSVVAWMPLPDPAP
jgi:hypothetical protein